MATFRATLELHGKTATGIEVPADVVEALGGGKRPPVVVAFSGHTYRTTLGVMGGRCLIPVSAEHRTAAGADAGDVLDVTITLDEAPREVPVPPALTAALKKDSAAKAAFDKLPPSGRKRHILAIEGAKTDETRERRLAKILAELGG